MNDQQPCGEEIRPGEEASVENRSESALSIAVCAAGGTRINLELAPGQTLEIAAGDVAARVVLRSGSPDDVLIVKPGQAS